MNNNHDSTDQKLVREDSEEVLASRWSRLAASVIDSLILIILIVATMYLMGLDFGDNDLDNLTTRQDIALGIFSMALFFLINLGLLMSTGQTLGKKLIGIKIVSMDSENLSFFKNILPRYLVYFTPGAIPVIGQYISLINVVFIFRNDHRCVHDHVGNTKVIQFQQVKHENRETKKSIPIIIKVMPVVVMLAIILMFTGHIRMSTADLQVEVENSIRDTLPEEPSFTNTKINSLILVHKSGNQYEGLLDITRNGKHDKLVVDVTYDGKRFMWQIRR